MILAKRRWGLVTLLPLRGLNHEFAGFFRASGDKWEREQSCFRRRLTPDSQDLQTAAHIYHADHEGALNDVLLTFRAHSPRLLYRS